MHKLCLLIAISCLVVLAVNARDLDRDLNDPLVHNDAFIAFINRVAKTWVAGKNKVFEGKRRSDIVKMLGFKKPSMEMRATFPVKPIHTGLINLPTNYSAVTDVAYTPCTQLHRIRNQGQCGACWAFGTSEMIADRFCIATKTKVNTVLSPQFLLSCDEYEGDCGGGDVGNTLAYIQNYGIVTNDCIPFLARNGSDLPCPNKCLDGSNFKLRYKVKNSHQFQQTDISGMQQSILTSGPVVAAFNVYEDFVNYKEGVYVHKTGGYLGGHVVKIVGWGETNDRIPYWVVANSWSTDWGLNGYFLIIRGQNECQFESYIWETTPVL